MPLKVIAFDVYGTVLFHGDPENCMPPRNGFVEFAKMCLDAGVILVTSSDNSLTFTKIDLEESGVPMHIFTSHFQMKFGQPKDFRPILEQFKIKPRELCVFGDREDLDVFPAIEQGCRGVIVPVYERKEDFDFMKISLDLLLNAGHC